MKEFFVLLKELSETIKKQNELLREFTRILDEEEAAISSYSLPLIEKSFVLKDQHAKISRSVEEKRISLLKKIFYMIAFDSRGQKHSMTLFKTVFDVYMNNVKNMISEEDYVLLEEIREKLWMGFDELEETFKIVSPRIYRNQEILKKVLRHVSLSLSMFQSESDVGLNYNSSGQTKSKISGQESISYVRVKA